MSNNILEKEKERDREKEKGPFKCLNIWKNMSKTKILFGNFMEKRYIPSILYIWKKSMAIALLYSLAIICFMIISGSLVSTVPKNEKTEEKAIASSMIRNQLIQLEWRALTKMFSNLYIFICPYLFPINFFIKEKTSKIISKCRKRSGISTLHTRPININIAHTGRVNFKELLFCVCIFIERRIGINYWLFKLINALIYII